MPFIFEYIVRETFITHTSFLFFFNFCFIITSMNEFLYTLIHFSFYFNFVFKQFSICFDETLFVYKEWVRISETDHPNWMKIQIYFKMIFYDSVYHS